MDISSLSPKTTTFFENILYKDLLQAKKFSLLSSEEEDDSTIAPESRSTSLNKDNKNIGDKYEHKNTNNDFDEFAYSLFVKPKAIAISKEKKKIRLNEFIDRILGEECQSTRSKYF